MVKVKFQDGLEFQWLSNWINKFYQLYYKKWKNTFFIQFLCKYSTFRYLALYCGLQNLKIMLVSCKIYYFLSETSLSVLFTRNPYVLIRGYIITVWQIKKHISISTPHYHTTYDQLIKSENLSKGAKKTIKLSSQKFVNNTSSNHLIICWLTAVANSLAFWLNYWLFIGLLFWTVSVEFHRQSWIIVCLYEIKF